jgi:hypothetical protein
MRGDLPTRALALVLERASLHRDELLAAQVHCQQGFVE